MTPAFTVGYIDKLDHLFKKPLRDIMSNYQVELGSGADSKKETQTNLPPRLRRITPWDARGGQSARAGGGPASVGPPWFVSSRTP